MNIIFRKRPLALIFIGIFLAGQFLLLAVPADRTPRKFIQPDGTEITIISRGDEYLKYSTTLDDYLVIIDSDGYARYGKLDSDGIIKSTGVKANNEKNRKPDEVFFVKKLTKGTTLLHQNIINRKVKVEKLPSDNLKRKFPSLGSDSSLVILVNFAGANEQFVTPNPKQAFTNLLNQSGNVLQGTASARDYFQAASNGLFNPKFVVVGPYTLPQVASYYGANDLKGDDVRPQQMVIDACKLAYNSGVDFSKFDSDNDGFVDNVFIYYAGRNEAESSTETTLVWPHRWSLPNYQTKFNGKVVYDYACTSELKGSSGSTMCGIGTFCHEFGHVLGLPDYYVTSGVDFYTLYVWNIMDYGAYLNGGKTPPTYSAFDRFYLNWLTPIEIRSSQNITLNPLGDSNEALIFTQNGNHNLIGNSPSPTEFFTLENRQKTGWDTYLPGHGLMITRINYNQSDWDNNQPNNNAAAMGVDIIEADKTGSYTTLSGDLFPGTSNVRYYFPSLRDGTQINKRITNIQETNGIINFDFMGGAHVPFVTPPNAIEPRDITTGSFTCQWEPLVDAEGYYLTVYKVSAGNSFYSEGFQNGLEGLMDWKITSSSTSISSIYSGKAIPAIGLGSTSDSITTEKYVLPVKSMSFFLCSESSLNSKIQVEAWNGTVWTVIDQISISTYIKTTKKYNFIEADNYTRFRISYLEGTNKCYADDVEVEFFKNVEFIKKDFWTTNTYDTIVNLLTNTSYFYGVKGSNRAYYSDNTLMYEDITNLSNIIETRTLEDRIGNLVRIKNDGSGTVVALLKNLDLPIKIYDITGVLIAQFNPDAIYYEIKNLQKKSLYILQVGEVRVKFMIP